MERWSIRNRASGEFLGVHEGETEQAAIEALHRDSGYRDAVVMADQSIEELRAELLVERTGVEADPGSRLA